MMIEAVAPVDQIRRVYGFYSHFYGCLVAPLERGPRLRGLDAVGIRPGDRVLEVAVGPGATFVDILRRVGPNDIVYGVDLSPKMLLRTRRAAGCAGFNRFDLREGDARRLPFADGAFDVLVNSYMLDLIPLGDLPVVLSEFHRVLSPGGRMALVNMSKEDETRRTFWEWFYESLPRAWVPYVMGGCRPVLMEGPVKMAGFTEVRREYARNIIPSEVVVARRP